MLQKSVLK